MGYIFISYSSENREIVDKAADFFAKNNIETWIAPDDIPVGSRYAQVINMAVKNCACFVLMLTKEAMGSTWVSNEIERAIHYKKTIVPIKLEEFALSDEFEFYLSTSQMIAISGFEKSDNTLAGLVSMVKTHAELSNYEKKTLENELMGNAQGEEVSVPEGMHSIPDEPKKSKKSKAISKNTIIMFVCSAVVVLGLLLTIVITMLGSNNNGNNQDNYPNGPNSISNTQITTDNNLIPDSETEPKTEAPTQTVSKNEIPQMHENKVTALKYSDSLTKETSTIRVKVGEYASPSAAYTWSNAKIYSQNTDIAASEGVLVKGVSKGDTYIIVESALGTAVAYYVVVE